MSLPLIFFSVDGVHSLTAPAGTRAVRAIEDVNVVALDPEYRGKKIFAVRPLNPLHDATARTEEGQPRHDCLDWLDKQPPASVLYVSFGTTSTLPAGQVAELAAALRDSKQRFLWVLRDADRGEVHEEEAADSRHAKLVSELTKQTEGMGLVITQWAPQLEILAHGVHEPLRLELDHGEPEPREAHPRLAHALRPAAGCGARVQVPQGRDHGAALG
jgi:hypothetical protein